MIARPLINLLENGKIGWLEEAIAIFQTLKKPIIITPTLAMQNFKKPLEIEVNALGEGISAVLSQHGKPIAFMSRALEVTKKS